MRLLASFLFVVAASAQALAQTSGDGTDRSKQNTGPDVDWMRAWKLRLDNDDTVWTRFQSLRNGTLNVYLDVAPERLVSIPAARVERAQTKRSDERRGQPHRSSEPDYNAMVQLTDGTRLWGRFFEIRKEVLRIVSPQFGNIPIPLHRVRELQLGVTPRDTPGVSGLGIEPGPLALVGPTCAEFVASWHDLAGNDTFRIWEATKRFQRGGDRSMEFLEARLEIPPDSLASVQMYVALLGASRADVRDAALWYLLDQQPAIEPRMMVALAQSHSPEVRRRIELLLESRANNGKSPRVRSRDIIRVERVLLLLQEIGHDRARKLIQHVADNGGSVTAGEATRILSLMDGR